MIGLELEKKMLDWHCEFEKISTCFLMRKLRITYDKAIEILNEFYKKYPKNDENKSS